MNNIENYRYDSNDIDGVPGDILVDMHCNSDNDTTLDDCSVNFQELPSLEPSLLKDSSFSDFHMQDYWGSDSTVSPDEDVPSTPLKRKRDDEHVDELSMHFFTDDVISSPMTTPSLPPKKAAKLRIATPSTDDDTTVAHCNKDDNMEFQDPLLAMPLSEIPSGFDTLMRPDKICSGTKTVASPRSPIEGNETKTIVCHPEAPNGTGEVVRTTSRKGMDLELLPLPELEICRPKAMLPQVTLHPVKDPVSRQLLFPPMEASPFIGLPVLTNKSKLSFPLALATSGSIQSNPSISTARRPLPKLLPRNYCSNPFDSRAVFKPVTPSTPRLPREDMFLHLAAVGPLPQNAMKEQFTRPAAAVTPEQHHMKMTVQETPKVKVKRGRPPKKTPTSKTAQEKKQAAKKKAPVKKETPVKRPAIKKKAKKTKQQYQTKNAGKWSKRYEEAKAFIKTHGHGLIPNQYSPNPDLGGWAKRQRYQYQLFTKNRNNVRANGTCKSSISEERIELLNKIGFCWQHKTSKWENRYEDLKRFVQKYGHAAVPTTFAEDQTLSGWVKVQRRQYKLFLTGEKSSMTMERINLLNKLGFCWSIKNITNAPGLEEPPRAVEQPPKDNVLVVDKISSADMSK
ncbi:unnamed protein product [Cylindrotheca closterium]|uniref:Helicase-associated domain-containing protein n=1 Tax=Cylindrotheca closterium TaxID=2856 RepID=A0AAD2FVY6_9STRA|nr:unnamed protein product [Cylindrotheca closterium]